MAYFVEGLSGHWEAEPKVRRIGEYETLEEAVASAKRIIDGFLRREYKSGTDSKTLLYRYKEAGEHPYIFRDDQNTLNVPGFTHLQYATTRCDDICSGKK